MNKDDWKEILSAVFIITLMGLLVISAWGAGGVSGREAVQREAVMNGVAEWRPDENGNPQFQWKKP